MIIHSDAAEVWNKEDNPIYEEHTKSIDYCLLMA